MEFSLSPVFYVINYSLLRDGFVTAFYVAFSTFEALSLMCRNHCHTHCGQTSW